nr:riboflavin kinase [Geobacter sp. FeAm09]
MVAVDGRILQGACNIGNNPTFEGGVRTIEAFLLDFSGQLYGREIAICFVQRLRGVMKFPDAAALIAAIQQDVATTRTILAAADQSLIKPLFSPEQIGE